MSYTRQTSALCATMAVLVSGAVFMSGSLWGQDRDTKVRNDREAFETIDAWVYNELDVAFEQSRRSKKPILAVLRCVP